MTEKPAQFSIREINVQTDLRPIADLIKASFQEFIDPDGQQFIDRLNELSYRVNNRFPGGFLTAFEFNLLGYVAVSNEQKIIGTTHLFPATTHAGTGYLIANVCVDQEYRKHGIASALLQHCERFAQRRNIKNLYLHARIETPQAIHFYLKRGFTQDAFRTSWIRPRGQKPFHIQSILRIGKPKWQERKLFHHQFAASYPKELLWNLNYRPDLFSLNPFNRFMNFLNGSSANFHRVSDPLNRPICWLVRQPLDSFADTLWFIPNEIALPEELVESLQLISNRYQGSKPLMVNCEADTHAETFAKAGFSRHNRLVWMSKKLF